MNTQSVKVNINIGKLGPGKVCHFHGIAHKYTYNRSNCPPRLGKASIFLFWAENDSDRSAKIYNCMSGYLPVVKAEVDGLLSQRVVW